MLFDRGGFRLNYRIDGTKGAPWLTLSNSLVCSLGMWDGQVERLAGHFRILRYDQRGHGGSEAPQSPYSVGELACDVVALWDHLGINRSHFAGLSLGGMTGISLALDFADRVASLTAADCRAEADPTYAGMFMKRVEATRTQGMEALVESTLARFFTPDFALSSPDTVEKYNAMIRNTNTEGHIGCCLAIAGMRNDARLVDLAVPTLFIGGRHDIGAPVAIMQAMHEAVAGSCHVVLENAGHISCEEAPDAFARAVLEHAQRDWSVDKTADRRQETS